MDIVELRVYQESMKMAEEIWNIVIKWDYFSKDTIGKQLVRSADSVAANLSEGFGRFHYKENINFCYYSRGSLYETKTWLTKAYNRSLISENEYQKFESWIKDVGIKLNNYISSIGKFKKTTE
ncbi:MAG: four helix bundle protein [Spirosomaceae bacterium]|jgi:four helix bundle protein|nr:four helix bundle protein [Spirosomataceae bacterium]